MVLLRLQRNACNLMLAHAIPVLQSRFRLTLEKIDAAQKAVGIGIGGIELE
jgi:hypothetical protein